MSNDGALDLICPVMHGHSKCFLWILSVESHKRWRLRASKRTCMRVWNKDLLSERTTRLRFRPIHHGSESTNTSLCIHAWTQGWLHSSFGGHVAKGCGRGRRAWQENQSIKDGAVKFLLMIRKPSIWPRVKTASAARSIILTEQTFH